MKKTTYIFLLFSFIMIGLMYSVQPVSGVRTCFAIEKGQQEISYEESHTFHDGMITALDNMRGIQAIEAFYEDFFKKGCDRTEIDNYLQTTYQGVFTCQAEEDGVLYKDIPLMLSYDISNLDTSVGEADVTAEFVAPSGLVFAAGVKHSITFHFTFSEQKETKIELDVFPNRASNQCNWIFPAGSKETFYDAPYGDSTASLYQQIKTELSTAYGVSSTVDMYDGVELEVKQIDVSKVDFGKPGIYDVSAVLDVPDDLAAEYYLAQKNKKISFQIYVVDGDSYKLCPISDNLNGYAVFQWYGSEMKKGVLYVAYSDSPCSESEAYQLDYKVADDRFYSIYSTGKFNVIQISDSVFQTEYAYFYLENDESTSNYIGMSFDDTPRYLGQYSGNRDGGDVTEPVRKPEQTSPSEQTTLVSPTTGTYTTTVKGVTVSLDKALSAKLTAKGEKIKLKVTKGDSKTISLKVDSSQGKSLEFLPGTSVYLPYKKNNETSKLRVKDKENNVVSTAAYDEKQGVASFSVDAAGTYTIEESGYTSKSGFSVVYIIAGVSVLILLGIVVGIRRRMR